VGWAGGLGLTALYCAYFIPGEFSRRCLVAGMAFVWSTRLAWHLYTDRVRGKSEDGRYVSLRKAWAERANLNFFIFFQAQAALDVLLAIPFALLCARSGKLGLLDGVGFFVWMMAIIGEWTADRQLASFRAKPDSRGKTMRSGLWAWSRHPNYFFEWSHWVSYALMAPGLPGVWLSPVVMLYFLLRVTGIPATEAQALLSRGEDYRRYQQTTSMFIPWFPKKER
jgi:steroid 5-alpha reductase family enzyme